VLPAENHAVAGLRRLTLDYPIVVWSRAVLGLSRRTAELVPLGKNALSDWDARPSASANSLNAKRPDISRRLSLVKFLRPCHCHHKALMKMELMKNRYSERRDVNCSRSIRAVAGWRTIGFERDKFVVSQAVGERVLLPAVRSARQDTLIVRMV